MDDSLKTIDVGKRQELGARASHASHPSTESYVAKDDGADGPGGYDGAQDSFGREPRLVGDPSCGSGQVGEGQALVAGLSLPSGAVADSWTSLVAREPRLDLSGFEFHSETSREAGCDWKIFMEIYLDDYHVEPFHPGLASMADCGQLTWLWENEAQAQVVGSASGPAGSASYAKLAHEAVSALGPGARGAVWSAIYPGTMVEWLAGGVAVSMLEPTGPGRCVNRVVFAYPKGVAESFPEFIRAHQAAYWETAREDDEIAERIQVGRTALAAAGRDESGPIHPHMEAGIAKFHDWIAARSWRLSDKDLGKGPKHRGKSGP